MSKTTITENDIRLTAYAVGEMDAQEKQQFERLLADSPEAQAEVQAIRELSENLSTEFERELSAVEGQQPLAGVDNVIDADTEFADHSDSSDKVRRPRFWAFGTIAAGLAATVMVTVYSLKDTSFDRQGISGDVALSEMAASADFAIERSDADISELRGDVADQLAIATTANDDGNEAIRASVNLKKGVSGPAPADEKQAGSLALAPATEAAAKMKTGDAPGASQANSSSARVTVTTPSNDTRSQLSSKLSEAERYFSNSDGAKVIGGGGSRANVAFANAAPGENEGGDGEAMSSGKGPTTAGSRGMAGAYAEKAADAAPAITSTAPMPAKKPGAVAGVASGIGPLANATPAPAPAPAPAPTPTQLEYRQRPAPSPVVQPVPAAASAGSLLTAGNRSGAHAVSDKEIDALIDLAKAGEAVRDNFSTGRGSRRGITGRQGGDRHASLTDNRFKDPLVEALSTFSIDVDTASYAQLRRSLLRDGNWPHPDEVRIEELINYFDYDYPAPDWDEVKAGDVAPFAVSLESAPAPWAPKHRLVGIGLKSAELSEKRPAANLVFLLDVSGSMNNADKLPLLQKALRALVPQLRAEDSVTMVAYAGRAGEVLPPTPGDDRDTILAAIDALSAGGSTNGAGGITLAYQRARERFVDGGVNRVILATDGDFNVGVSNDDALVKLVEKQAQSDVFLTVLGFGSGNLNDSMMEKITNKGNGNYFYIDGVPEAKKVLVEQMAGTLVTVAKDVKIQVDFNPGKVAAYRLIGYANRMLKREDFDNDKVDAGEIGAGHTVTALYEIVPVGVAMELTGQDVEGLKYQKRLKAAAEQDLEAKRQKELADQGIEMSDSHEMLTVKLRYKQPTAKESALLEFPLVDEDLIPGRKAALKAVSADFQFASAVAAFGMRVRNSQYISKDYSFAAIAELAAGVAEVDDENETKRRKEFVTMVEKAAGNEPSASDGVTRDVQERLKQLR